MVLIKTVMQNFTFISYKYIIRKTHFLFPIENVEWSAHGHHIHPYSILIKLSYLFIWQYSGVSSWSSSCNHELDLWEDCHVICKIPSHSICGSQWNFMLNIVDHIHVIFSTLLFMVESGSGNTWWKCIRKSILSN